MQSKEEKLEYTRQWRIRNKDRQAATAKARRQKLKDAGLCQKCAKNSTINSSFYCDNCKEKEMNIKYPYRKFLKDICENCGFIPENMCQLDVHHIDKNHYNNDPTNLKTLCCNCHALQHRG